ncbi:aldehyde dehydrogenase family protein [Halobellus limi]|nr:aldehyde dehydrogenase family protein [Halobellus limi]
MTFAREEIFGPVASVITIDEAEALEVANDTDYGLEAGVWTTDIHPEKRMTDGLRAGHRLGQRVSDRRTELAVRRLQGQRPRPQELSRRTRGVLPDQERLDRPLRRGGRPVHDGRGVISRLDDN